jgi:RimJ/RimL family protein N-acetyltransferase
MKIRQADKDDIYAISRLYFDVYGGTYPDSHVKDFLHISEFLNDPNLHWLVAISENKIIASVIYKYDPENKIAKAFGAVVEKQYRGHDLTEQMMQFGKKHLEKLPNGVDIIYATTRTINASAQILTEKQGYKKLGIFPNVRKAANYETHCLTALFLKSSFQNRFKDFKLHPDIFPLYNLVNTELNMGTLDSADVEIEKDHMHEVPELEFVRAPNFVNHRYEQLKNNKELTMEFYPFHTPNIMVTSPDQSVELFINLEEDGYCAILGGHVELDLDFKQLLLALSHMLRDNGARYLEIIVRSDLTDLVDSALHAKFIPSAYFPAFQLIGDQRYDFIVFSRSFEIFDFQNMELEGRNREFLQLYFEQWEKIALNPKLIKV